MSRKAIPFRPCTLPSWHWSTTPRTRTSWSGAPATTTRSCRPDLAVPCLTDFRKCARSGADTLYRLGQAYEQLGDRARALKCYEHVTSYDNHPLLYEAREAIHRVKAS